MGYGGPTISKFFYGSHNRPKAKFAYPPNPANPYFVQIKENQIGKNTNANCVTSSARTHKTQCLSLSRPRERANRYRAAPRSTAQTPEAGEVDVAGNAIARILAHERRQIPFGDRGNADDAISIGRT